MTAAATDPLAPKPQRERTSLIAGQLQVIIDRHEQTRPATPPRHRGDPPTDEPPTP
jgi:hypothetical protein